jgi:hypothetical protein
MLFHETGRERGQNNGKKERTLVPGTAEVSP